MKILLTGASGFLGKVINQANLICDESQILTLGRNNSQITCDLSGQVPELPEMDLVIHAAGKAHSVPRTANEVSDFFKVNVKGTENLLSGLENAPGLPQSFIFISTIAVYGKASGNYFDENTFLAAEDAYGRSKIEAEAIIDEWCRKRNISCAILRLPLIAGPNPPGNLNSMIRGIKKGYYFNIDGAKARKSIVLADDVAKIIPRAAETGGIFNLTDGYHPSFSELSDLIAKQLGKSKPPDIPRWLAMLMARAGDVVGTRAPINSDKLRKITSDLTFDDSKARRELGWNPTPVLEGFKIR